MSKFIRVNKEDDSERTTILNLAWVAKIELFGGPTNGLHAGNDRIHASCISDDGVTIATLHFDDLSAAHEWVLTHLGIQL